MAEIYLVWCEATNKVANVTESSDAGYSTDYQKAKARLHKCIEEEKAEGAIPEDHNGWNGEYEDEFVYEDDTKKIIYYVCAIQPIED